MAITTTPTEAMKTAIKDEFVSQFGGGSPPSTEEAIATALAEVMAKCIELALTEVKTNADVVGVSSGGDTVAGGVD
jgi:hypothetical protein